MASRSVGGNTIVLSLKGKVFFFGVGGVGGLQLS